MMLEHHQQPSSLTTALEIANYVFIVTFAIEAALKLAIYGVTCYFSDAWNKFDFFIVVMSFVGLP